MKRIVTLLLAVLMLLALCPAALAEGEPPTRTFTDSVGRTVELPAAIDKVAVSGPLAQIVLFALCPDKLVGIASPWDETAVKYFDTKYYELPVLGQLYGGKGEEDHRGGSGRPAGADRHPLRPYHRHHRGHGRRLPEAG